MLIPIRVLWTLKMSLIEKISIGGVFVVGIITMVFAIVRSVSLDSSVTAGQVSTTWLMLVRRPSLHSTTMVYSFTCALLYVICLEMAASSGKSESGSS